MNDRVLFVDDEANVLSAFRRSFRGVFNMDTAANAVEAMTKVVNGERYAVVVSDMNMPGITGLQLLQQVQLRAPDTVRLILTGNADVTSAVQALDRGEIHRYLTKPCSADRLRDAVREAISAHRVARTKLRRDRAPLPPNMYEVPLDSVKPGDVLGGDVATTTGAVLLRRGEVVTRQLLARIVAHDALTPIRQPLLVSR